MNQKDDVYMGAPSKKFTELSKEIFQEGYWNRPIINIEKKYDTDEKLVYQAVGKCLSAWQGVIDWFEILCVAFSKAKTQYKHIVHEHSFGFTDSLDEKIVFLENSAEAYLGDKMNCDEISKPLKDIISTIRNASYRRNEIAHGKVLFARRLDFEIKKLLGTNDHSFILRTYECPMVKSISKYEVCRDRIEFRRFFGKSVYYTSFEIDEFAEKLSNVKIMLMEYTNFTVPTIPSTYFIM